MKRKLHSQPGFTLIEVLLVVALIVILLAISIPAVMGAVNDARCKADAKYERAAMAALTALVQTGSFHGDKDTEQYLFDAGSGKLIYREDAGTQSGYKPCGECRKHGHSGQYLWAEYNKKTKTYQIGWAKSLGTSAPWGNNLCSDAQ